MSIVFEEEYNKKIENYVKNIKNYNGLCLSSGGINGWIFIGILSYLYRLDKLNEIKYYIGTSIGAIICLLLILDYKPLEILKLSCNNNISEYFTLSISNIKEGYGLYNIENLKLYLKQLILYKTNGIIPTFKELFDKTNKIFYCTSYCLNPDRNSSNNNKIYFNYKDYPDMNVLDAVISSASLPLVFTKNKLNENYYIDGGLFDHFPINKLYNIMYNDIQDDKHINILALEIGTKKIDKINSIGEYIFSILNIVCQTQETETIINILKEKKIIDYIVSEKEFTMNYKDTILSRIQLICDGIKLVRSYYSEFIK